jgi:acyl-CoA dehydrogenase
MDDLAEGTRFAFGITEPNHGSDATHMETVAVRDGDHWVINGEKTWNTGVHTASQHDHGAHLRQGRATAAASPRSSCPPSRRASRCSSTCGRSTCPPTTRTSDAEGMCACPTAPSFGGEGRGLQVAQHFFNENRIRQAASSLGAAQYCIDEAVAYAQ